MRSLSPFFSDNKVGFKNDIGKVVIAPRYDGHKTSFSNEYEIVSIKGKWGVISTSGDILVPFDYDVIRYLFDGYSDDVLYVERLDATNKRLSGVINGNNEIIIPLDYQIITSKGRYIRVELDHGSDLSARKDKTLIAWYNSKGKRVYCGDDVVSIDEPFLIVERDGLLGVIDKSGTLVISCSYDEIHCFAEHYFVVRKTINEDGEWAFGVLSKNDSLVVNFEYKNINWENGWFSCYRECDCETRYGKDVDRNHRYRYMNQGPAEWYNNNGKCLFKGQGEAISEKFLCVKDEGGKCGLINTEGVLVLRYLFDSIDCSYDKLIVLKDGRLGVFESDGQLILDISYSAFEFVHFEDFKEPFYARWSFTPDGFQYGKYSAENPFSTSKGTNRRYIPIISSEHWGKERIISCPLKERYSWSDTIVLKNNGYDELFRYNSGVVPNSRFDIIWPISYDHYVVKQNDKYGLFLLSVRQLLLPCEYDQIEYRGGDYVLISKDGLWGAKYLSDPNLDVLSPEPDLDPKFLEISPLGLKTGRYDCNAHETEYFSVLIKESHRSLGEISYFTIVESGDGTIVPAFRFSRNGNYEEHFVYYGDERLLTLRNNHWGFVSISGYVSVPFKYDEIIPRLDRDFDVRIDDRWGVLCLSGKEIVPVKYKERLPDYYGECVVCDSISGKEGVLSVSGEEVVPTIYDHIIQKRDHNGNSLSFCGYGGSEEGGNFFSEFDFAKWGCINHRGEQIIPNKYDCLIIDNDYILAGRDGHMVGSSDEEYGHDYSGVFDLYTLDGEIIFGGFSQFQQIDGFLLFLLNGQWVEYNAFNDYYNNIHINDYHFDTKNATWLVLDHNLTSVKRGKNKERIHFEKGFIVDDYENDFDKSILLREEPVFSDNYLYLITKGKNQSQAIRIKDGEETDCYDEVGILKEKDLFFVKQEEKVGIIALDGKIVIPFDYWLITNPVGDYMFAFKERQDGDCSVDCIILNNEMAEIIPVSLMKDFDDIFVELRIGCYQIVIDPGEIGLRSIRVSNPSLFDNEFSSRISQVRTKDTPFCAMHEEKKYWFPYSLDLNDYEPSCCDEEYHDYEGDTWDAMTDGMYGDMPDGFDGDYSFLGRD